MRLLTGTTWTRLANRFAVLLLMMTAGRRLRTSPPVARSKDTHQISPRFIVGDVGQVGFAPCVGLGFTVLVGCHCAVAGRQRVVANERSGKVLQEPADVAATDEGMKPAINIAVD